LHASDRDTIRRNLAGKNKGDPIAVKNNKKIPIDVVFF
jgi:hypothetical protein